MKSKEKFTKPEHYRNRIIMLQFIEGHPLEAIAEKHQMELPEVRKVLSDASVKAEMDRYTQTVMGRVESLADEAVDTVRDTMRGEQNSELRFKAANSLLDRNPEFSKKSEVREIAEGLGEGMIRAISKRLREESGGVYNSDVAQGDSTGSLPLSSVS